MVGCRKGASVKGSLAACVWRVGGMDGFVWGGLFVYCLHVSYCTTMIGY
jgi:hypothetical protein